MQRPKPFDELKDPNPFWLEKYKDPFDELVPKGFISDVVYYFRGTEVPTVYAVWGALVAISAVIKREAWLQWYPDCFFSNLFVILIGPAGGKKSTIVNFIIKLLKNFHIHISNKEWRELKRLNILKNKASPEGILEMMLPSEALVEGEVEGEFKAIRKGSEIFIGLTEMSVMLNKQQYNTSTIQNLLDLYDAFDEWEWTTKSDKKRVLKDIYTTILAATTPSGFKESVPTEAIGDGFLSRTIIANSGVTERRFFVPQAPANAPTDDVLAERLAYVAQAMQGSYRLSDEAYDYLNNWYDGFCETRDEAGEDAGIISRQNIHVLKLAFLLHAQSYPHPRDKEISLETAQMAKSLMEATYLTAYNAVNQVKHKGEFEDVFKVREYILNKGKVDRKTLLASTRIKGSRINTILKYLHTQGYITIWDEDGNQLDKPYRKTCEVYKYDGPEKLTGVYKEWDGQTGKTGPRPSKD